MFAGNLLILRHCRRLRVQQSADAALHALGHCSGSVCTSPALSQTHASAGRPTSECLHAIGDLCSPLHIPRPRVAPQQNRGSIAQHIRFRPVLPKSKGHSRKAAGLVQLNKPPNHCAAGSACARNSFTPKINRFDTPPETKLFCSAFDAVTEAQASCLTRPAGF